MWTPLIDIIPSAQCFLSVPPHTGALDPRWTARILSQHLACLVPFPSQGTKLGCCIKWSSQSEVISLTVSGSGFPVKILPKQQMNATHVELLTVVTLRYLGRKLSRKNVKLFIAFIDLTILDSVVRTGCRLSYLSQTETFSWGIYANLHFDTAVSIWGKQSLSGTTGADHVNSHPHELRFSHSAFFTSQGMVWPTSTES